MTMIDYERLYGYLFDESFILLDRLKEETDAAVVRQEFRELLQDAIDEMCEMYRAERRKAKQKE